MHFHISYLLFIVFLKVSSQMKGSIKGKQQTTVSSENTGPDREQWSEYSQDGCDGSPAGSSWCKKTLKCNMFKTEVITYSPSNLCP